jgi:hypothetical protein
MSNIKESKFCTCSHERLEHYTVHIVDGSYLPLHSMIVPTDKPITMEIRPITYVKCGHLFQDNNGKGTQCQCKDFTPHNSNNNSFPPVHNSAY